MSARISTHIEQLGPDRFIVNVALSGTRGGYDLIYCAPAGSLPSATEKLKGFLARLRTATLALTQEETA
jgi:hypothetical protein